MLARSDLMQEVFRPSWKKNWNILSVQQGKGKPEVKKKSKHGAMENHRVGVSPS